MAGLPAQDDGERSHLDQHLADDAENLHAEEIDTGIAERLGVSSLTRALQPRGTVAIPDQGSGLVMVREGRAQEASGDDP